MSKQTESSESPNLNINSETICHIIYCAREFHAKEGVSFPETQADSDYEYDPLQILADHQDDLTFQDAKKTIEALEPDQQIELVALMYIGRGIFDFNEWEAAKKESANNFPPQLAEYLFSKPELPYYLEKGIEFFGFSCDS